VFVIVFHFEISSRAVVVMVVVVKVVKVVGHVVIVHW
jgi:hypothetical protein